jgi:hypothetical protein
VVAVLQGGASHEALVCLAAYVLGEYGRLIKVCARAALRASTGRAQRVGACMRCAGRLQAAPP